MRPVTAAVCLGLALILGTGALRGTAHAKGRVAAPELPANSLYQLDATWHSDLGKEWKLSRLRGKIRVLTLFFGHCESSCPMVLSKLKGLEQGLRDDWAERAGFVLVSLDPARDDPSALSRFRKHAGLSAKAWTLLRGDESDTRELAMLLDVSYRTSGTNGGVEHDAVIALLDGEGRILGRFDGAAPVDSLTAALHSAMQGGRSVSE